MTLVAIFLAIRHRERDLVRTFGSWQLFGRISSMPTGSKHAGTGSQGSTGRVGSLGSSEKTDKEGLNTDYFLK